MEATIIYPHQLFAEHPGLAKNRPVFLVEEALILTYNPIHRQKLVFHKLTLDAFATSLTNQGYTVNRLTIHEYPTTASVFEHLKKIGVQSIHLIDTTDAYLETAITKSGLTRVWYESPLFLLPRAESIERYQSSKRHLARFYRQLRLDWQILLTDAGEPQGGAWSFDSKNRQKLPQSITPPADPVLQAPPTVTEACAWAETVPARQYGSAGCWLPTTHAGAKTWLNEFLSERLTLFGPYEDAIATAHHRLWHSMLSPLLNVGLLTPKEVFATTLAYAETHTIPINSLEGFVRQLIGWREFIRAAYEAEGGVMRTTNFFSHSKPLPDAYWQGTTGLYPVDTAIASVLATGYSHHIERLMVLGNSMLLCGLHPNAVYEWFMGMYVDAYDWVMVPNVYGMSQFADGGSFATKPYISGSNYLKKMSNYPAGAWEHIWTSLYWNFVNNHETVFSKNHRLSMMPRLLKNMDETKRRDHLTTADQFLKTLHQT